MCKVVNKDYASETAHQVAKLSCNYHDENRVSFAVSQPVALPICISTECLRFQWQMECKEVPTRVKIAIVEKLKEPLLVLYVWFRLLNKIL